MYNSKIKNGNNSIGVIEDEIIRGKFRNYDKRMSSIVEENYKMRKPLNCDCEVFCGWFVARIYVKNKLIGKYKFDCSSFDVPYFTADGNETTRITKV